MKTKLLKNKDIFLRCYLSKKSKNFILLLFIHFIFINSYGNTSHYNSVNKQLNNNITINQEINDDSWTEDKTVNNVIFYHKLVTCGDKKAVLLKFENKNNFSVEISWKEIVGSKQVPNPNDEFSTTNTLIIQSGITQPIDCSDLTNSILVILPIDVNPTFVADIETFNFSSITIKELN